MRFNDAVQPQFYDSGRKPMAVIFFSRVLDSFNVLLTQFRRVEKISDLHAYRKLSVTVKSVVEFQFVEIVRIKVAARSVNSC